MKRLLLVPILAMASLDAAPSADPFATVPSWSEAIVAAKPLVLEVCAGEINASAIPAEAQNVVSPESLASAKRLRIRVAPIDQGVVELPDQLTVLFQVKPKAANYDLQINLTLRSDDAGTRQTNTRFTLFPDAQWVVMGGFLNRERITNTNGVETTTTRNLIMAFRILSPAENP